MTGALEAVGEQKGRNGRIEAVDPRYVTQMMEQLQQGYVASVAATAGCAMEVVPIDIFGYDVRFVRPAPTVHEEESVVLAQLKCTTQLDLDPSKEYFSYQFTKRQYFDHMVKARSYPKAILVVMTAPPRQSEWTEADHAGLTTRRCCYWVHLEGFEAKSNVQKPSVRIPIENKFDAASLTEMINRFDRGESL
ncbi:DUF4365 domain-containing protein [Embleya sp. NPDC020630]|uniref:DUF4365 domain-containing protein n=1 Tax=Embleya sp. NPDC020630 TaxID=3363979 RepID=UPI0037B4D035